MESSIEDGSGPAPQEVETASIIERVLNGEELTERLGNWRINNAGRPRLVGFDYYTNAEDADDNPAATFVFDIDKTEGEKPINFWNTHRLVTGEKRVGTGTDALQSLQRALQVVSRKTRRAIVLDFPKENQDGTANWLTKLGYQEHMPNLFRKTITNL